MRGILTIEPRMEEEVIMIPLYCEEQNSTVSVKKCDSSEYYLPGSAKDGQSHGKADASVSPGIRTDAIKDIFPTCVHLLSKTYWRELVCLCCWCCHILFLNNKKYYKN